MKTTVTFTSIREDFVVVEPQDEGFNIKFFHPSGTEVLMHPDYYPFENKEKAEMAADNIAFWLVDMLNYCET